MFKEHMPWFSPDESVEACELFEEIAAMFQHMAEYAPLRKELRLQMADKARTCSEFVQRANRPIIERAVLEAVEVIAEKRKMKSGALLSQIIEEYISRINRSA